MAEGSRYLPGLAEQRLVSIHNITLASMTDSESPYADLDGAPALYEFISFAYNDKNGVYLTIYYSPCGESMKLPDQTSSEQKEQGQGLFDGRYVGWPASLK